MTTPLFKKLNLAAQPQVVVLNAPASFEHELAALQGPQVLRSLPEGQPLHFALAFVTTEAERDRSCRQMVKAAQGDALLWLAYPKASSKRLRCEFNRDAPWKVLGDAGYEPVRQVALDEDWSALRFRKVDFIKSLTRQPGMAQSAQGRQRAEVSATWPKRPARPG